MLSNILEILETLKIRFGQPSRILDSMIDKLKHVPVVKEDDFNSLVKFVTTVQNIASVAESLEQELYLINPQLLRELVGKLPCFFKI